MVVRLWVVDERGCCGEARAEKSLLKGRTEFALLTKKGNLVVVVVVCQTDEEEYHRINAVVAVPSYTWIISQLALPIRVSILLARRPATMDSNIINIAWNIRQRSLGVGRGQSTFGASQKHACASSAVGIDLTIECRETYDILVLLHSDYIVIRAGVRDILYFDDFTSEFMTITFRLDESDSSDSGYRSYPSVVVTFSSRMFYSGKLSLPATSSFIRSFFIGGFGTWSTSSFSG